MSPPCSAEHVWKPNSSVADAGLSGYANEFLNLPAAVVLDDMPMARRLAAEQGPETYLVAVVDDTPGSISNQIGSLGFNPLNPINIQVGPMDCGPGAYINGVAYGTTISGSGDDDLVQSICFTCTAPTSLGKPLLRLIGGLSQNAPVI